MKRKDILKKLAAAGCTFEEGGNHTRVYKNGRFVTAVGRHVEIADRMVRVLERQTGQNFAITSQARGIPLKEIEYAVLYRGV